MHRYGMLKWFKESKIVQVSLSTTNGSHIAIRAQCRAAHLFLNDSILAEMQVQRSTLRHRSNMIEGTRNSLVLAAEEDTVTSNTNVCVKMPGYRHSRSVDDGRHEVDGHKQT